MGAAVGVPDHERDILLDRRAYSHCDAREGRGWDVDVLKWVELAGLLLTLGALDWQDPHQHRLRVAHDLVVDDIRVEKERLENVQGGATVSTDC